MLCELPKFIHIYLKKHQKQNYLYTYAGLPQLGKNNWKMKFFLVQRKVREFCGWPGNLERSWKVREKSGNLKINGYDRQSSENLFCLRGERMYILMR